ncbi:protein kinase [Rhodococcus sp. ACS1]|nr:protein kinase [Rhodococcus sp. ACS1]
MAPLTGDVLPARAVRVTQPELQATEDTRGSDNVHTQNPRHLSILIGACAIAGGAVLLAPTANAAPVAECRAPGAASAAMAMNTSQCSADSVGGSAAAAYGIDGTATATAGPQALALAIANGGGTATSTARGLSGPAAIALGPGATVNAQGVRPGLSIGIAGAGAQVTIDGTAGPTCTRGPAFAGDFQTLRGCLSTQ